MSNVKNKICIIDYKTGGNIFSVKNSLEAVGADVYLSSSPEEISKATKIFFPGVGSFETAMKNLNALGLVEVLQKKALCPETPFLGICVGMQVLFSESTESSNGSRVKGLGAFAGSVEKFASHERLKVPHMGWNQVSSSQSSSKNPLFKGIADKENFYFVHSFRAGLEASEDTQALKSNQERFPGLEVQETNYGNKFISHIWDGQNLFACQFHTEKSGEAGLKLLENFVSLAC